MASLATPPVVVPGELVDSIRSFPPKRTVEHCGKIWDVSPFDIYAACPHCGATIKLRGFSACAEVEDVFDAVFEWMNQPGVDEIVRERRRVIADDA